MVDWQSYKKELIEDILRLDMSNKYSSEYLVLKTIQDLEYILYSLE